MLEEEDDTVDDWYVRQRLYSEDQRMTIPEEATEPLLSVATQLKGWMGPGNETYR